MSNWAAMSLGGIYLGWGALIRMVPGFECKLHDNALLPRGVGIIISQVLTDPTNCIPL